MGWEAKFLTKDEFDREWDALLKKQKWGRWTLDQKAHPSLDIEPFSNGSKYEVRLFQRGCGFPAFLEWLGHWTQHLQVMSWMSYKDLWDFVQAAQDLYRREAK